MSEREQGEDPRGDDICHRDSSDQVAGKVKQSVHWEEVREKVKGQK